MGIIVIRFVWYNCHYETYRERTSIFFFCSSTSNNMFFTDVNSFCNCTIWISSDCILDMFTTQQRMKSLSLYSTLFYFSSKFLHSSLLQCSSCSVSVAFLDTSCWFFVSTWLVAPSLEISSPRLSYWALSKVVTDMCKHIRWIYYTLYESYKYTFKSCIFCCMAHLCTLCTVPFKITYTGSTQAVYGP